MCVGDQIEAIKLENKRLWSEFDLLGRRCEHYEQVLCSIRRLAASKYAAGTPLDPLDVISLCCMSLMLTQEPNFAELPAEESQKRIPHGVSLASYQEDQEDQEINVVQGKPLKSIKTPKLRKTVCESNALTQEPTKL